MHENADNPYQSPSNTKASAEPEKCQRLSSGTLFKLIFIGFACSLGPLLFLQELGSLVSGSESIVTFNDQPLTGATGFWVSVVFIPFIVALLSAVTWVFLASGLWLYGLVRPLRLRFKGDDPTIR